METSLVKREMNVPEIMDVAKAFSASGYFKDARDAAQAAVKIMAGQELGIPPVAAMTGIAIVKEKVTLGANLIAALVKASKFYDYRVTKHTDTECVIQFYENGKPSGVSTFTMADAKRANLAGANWTQYPKAMLFARAITQGVRWNCPDVMSGIAAYTAEELGEDEHPAVEVVESTGEVIEAEVAAEPEPAAKPADDKRRKIIEAIFGDWDARQELDGAFAAWKRRKNSIIGQMKAAWPAIETADMNDEEAVLHWLETADLEQVRTYGRHNRKQRKAEAEAAELAEEEPGDGDAG